MKNKVIPQEVFATKYQRVELLSEITESTIGIHKHAYTKLYVFQVAGYGIVFLAPFEKVVVVNKKRGNAGLLKKINEQLKTKKNIRRIF